jgi:nucleotide-binding universal stress UspA family protein
MGHDVDIRTILLAYDGSESAEHAFDLARSMAHKYGSTVIVMHAFHHLPRVAQPSDSDVHEIHEGRELAAKVVDRLQAEGLEAVPDVLEGPAAEAILNASEARQVDLIVVGRRGHGKFSGLLLGSTTDRVLQYATVPVMVAR